MKKWMIGLGVLLVIGFIIMLVVSSIYNGAINRQNATLAGWSEVENQYQRRADLIPNLVETVKGYAAHEKQLFENVTQARSALLGAKTPVESAKANDALKSFVREIAGEVVREGLKVLNRASEMFNFKLAYQQYRCHSDFYPCGDWRRAPGKNQYFPLADAFGLCYDIKQFSYPGGNIDKYPGEWNYGPV